LQVTRSYGSGSSERYEERCGRCVGRCRSYVRRGRYGTKKRKGRDRSVGIKRTDAAPTWYVSAQPCSA